MAVKPGYKRTEAGVLPENWQVETISHLLEDKSILGHLDGNHGELYPRSSEFKQHGVPFIGANDFAEGFVSFERCKFLSKERASQFRKGVAEDGDVLFAHNATVGPIALLKTSEPFVVLSTTATYFRCNEEKLSNIYLKAALQSAHFVKQYQAVMAQSTRFQVPITAQRKLTLVTSYSRTTRHRAAIKRCRCADRRVGPA
jgi:type I restriction enzyme S subunit